jgi:CRISPR-associated exonuclease Cas4
MRVRSLTLGLVGVCDVVEFHRVGETDAGCMVPGAHGCWLPFPVEYKRGALRHEEGYAVQLCGQARCLEEMLQVTIPTGALFYGASHKRLDVAFDAGLRRAMETAAARLRIVLASATAPPPVNDARCRLCSMNSICLPGIARHRSARTYLHQNIDKMSG